MNKDNSVCWIICIGLPIHILRLADDIIKYYSINIKHNKYVCIILYRPRYMSDLKIS